jgi:hypothetical protein
MEREGIAGREHKTDGGDEYAKFHLDLLSLGQSEMVEQSDTAFL